QLYQHDHPTALDLCHRFPHSKPRGCQPLNIRGFLSGKRQSERRSDCEMITQSSRLANRRGSLKEEYSRPKNLPLPIRDFSMTWTHQPMEKRSIFANRRSPGALSTPERIFPSPPTDTTP